MPQYRGSQYKGLSDDSWLLKNIGSEGRLLFNVPSEAIQKSTVGKSGDAALKDAWTFWRFVRRMAAEHGKPIAGNSRILDFGVAWGRILRFFLRDTNASNLVGVDVTDALLQEAKAALPLECDLRAIQASPPLDCPDNTFDVIYAMSVFSHLPETLANAWVSEFERILKPGGIACLTTRPKRHFETDGIKALVGCEADAYIRKYESGDFAFIPLKGDYGSLPEDAYGEAAIPPTYVKSNWPLEFVSFEEKYSETYMQPCFVLRKTGAKLPKSRKLQKKKK